MKSKLVVALHILFALVIAWGLGLRQVRGMEGIPPSAPESPASSPISFTYQGVLKENGVPVTGVRSMTFQVTTGSDCNGSLYQNDGPKNVSVNNGLFTSVLTFERDFFNGVVSPIYLEVWVGGNSISCQQIQAVPFAISLLPGANMYGSVPGDHVLRAFNQSQDAAAVGVGGYATYGDGVRGESLYGNAIKAEGKFLGTEDSELVLSPFSMIQRYPTTNTTIAAMEHGGVALMNTGGSTETKYLVIPVSVFGKLFGTDMYAKSVTICFKGLSTSSYIDATQLLKNNGNNDYLYMVNSITKHASTSHICYTEDATVNRKFDNSTYLQLNIRLVPGEWFYVYTTKLTVTETP